MMRNDLNSKEEAVLLALMSGEDAEPLPELARRVEQNPADVALVIDGLVEQDILMPFESYHASDIGEIDYMFSFSEHAQAIYDGLLKK